MTSNHASKTETTPGNHTGRIIIGTSGWSYPEWKGPFYPKRMTSAEMLGFYSQHFSTVEVNTSFYHLPKPWVVEHWCETVPPGFLFSIKASRFITHQKRLNDPCATLRTFYSTVAGLGTHLGCILFQLPPRWHFNEQRLAAFLAALEEGHRCVFEFRDPSWINPTTSELLNQHGAALCIYDLEGHHSPREITTDFAYVRLHGPSNAYQGGYSEQALRDWAGSISGWANRGLDVYCYFNNDKGCSSVHDAKRLRQFLGLG